jgi:protein NDRG1
MSVDNSAPVSIERKHLITTERCGTLTVTVQGDLAQVSKKAVFLTVHDMGTNHNSFLQFIDHASMAEVKKRSVFIHVDIPGQENNAADLTDDFPFPRMQFIGEDLLNVLDNLRVQLVVGLGEGAGANILARFGMAHTNRCLGLILINPTATTASVMEYFKDKIIGWKLQSIGMNPTAEQYLVFHKFGPQLESADNKEKLIQDYTEKLKTDINPRNLKRYVEAYMNRTDISHLLEKNLNLETMLVTGSRAAHVQSMYNMHACMDKSKTAILKIDDVGDVLMEAPEKLAQSLLLFCKGIGCLTSVTMHGIERQRSTSGGEELYDGTQRRRTLSMEDYDQPRRKSITTANK